MSQNHNEQFSSPFKLAAGTLFLLFTVWKCTECDSPRRRDAGEINYKDFDAVEDIAVEDSAIEDSAVEDSAVEDSAIEDIAVEDIAVEDSAIEDSALSGRHCSRRQCYRRQCTEWKTVQ